MPMYDYKCVVCGHEFIDVKSIAERHTSPCPNCGGLGEHQITGCAGVRTDRNFGYTGKVDKRLGDKPIEGRQDFWKRCQERHLVEIDLKNMD